MVEGVSLRAIARLTDTDLNTIMSLLLTVGKKCRTLFDLRVRNVRPRFTEFDEIWCFVHTKERHLNAGDPAEWGDAYTWTAIDAQTKLLISYHIGKRDAESANTFVGTTDKSLQERMKELQVILLNLKVITTHAKALVDTLSEKPNRLIFSGKANKLTPEDEIIKSNKPLPARKP